MSEGGNLANVKCPRGGGKDSRGHCEKRDNIQIPTHTKEEPSMGVTGVIIRKLCTPNSSLNDKYVEVERGSH